jgi:hypothetical protein
LDVPAVKYKAKLPVRWHLRQSGGSLDNTGALVAGKQSAVTFHDGVHFDRELSGMARRMSAAIAIASSAARVHASTR